MENELLCYLGDNYHLNQLLLGNKPACTILSKPLTEFARSIGLSVQTSPTYFLKCYTISGNEKVRQHINLADVLGIVNTTKAKKLYNELKNSTPSKALIILQEKLRKEGELFEISVLNGFLYGYPICDIVEYLELRIKQKEMRCNKSIKYNEQVEYDYRIQRFQCAYCRKQYVKYGI